MEHTIHAADTVNVDHIVLLNLTTEIVKTAITARLLSEADVPAFVAKTYAALAALGGAKAPEIEKREPAVPIKKSITDTAIICLEDGKAFKSLKRHLMAHYGLTPDQYREKWGLPADYPMTAPSYAAKRSELAKKMGLGHSKKKAA